MCSDNTVMLDLAGGGAPSDGGNKVDVKRRTYVRLRVASALITVALALEPVVV